MSFSAVNTILLPLLALGAVPLLLHLFARTKPPVYEFSSVEFLRKIIRKTMRLKKPQDIILLILRTLAFLVLIGVFIRPLLFAQEKLSGLFQRKNLVVIIDASASMGLVEGAQTRFAKACAEASELLSGLSGNDSANVIWLDSEPDAVFPGELAVNLGYLRDQLRRARVTSERAAVEKSLQLARQLLDEAEGKREICIVSDFQRQAWEDFEPSLPEDIDLIHVKIGERDATNLAVANLRWEPPDPVVGEDLALYAEVRNFSAEAIQTTVFSEAGESRRSQNLTIEPWGLATAIFHHNVSASGLLPVSASVAEDAFPGDDRRDQALTARPFLRLGVWADAGSEIAVQTARVWTRAAQSLGWAVPETLDDDALKNLNPAEFDVLLLSGWKGGPSLEIPAATKVICLPGVSPSQEALAALFEIELGEERFTVSAEEWDKPFEVGVAAPDDPLFALFRDGEHGDPGGPAGNVRMKISQLAFPEAKSLLNWRIEGDPALTRIGPNRYLWNIPLAEEAGNYAAKVEFLPLFAELLLADRGATAGEAAVVGLDFEPGEPLLWSEPADAGSGEVSLLAPDDAPLAFKAEASGGYLSDPARLPGLHRWRIDGMTAGYSAVNFPAGEESDLRTLTLNEAEGAASVAVSGGSEVRNLRDGLKLWPWLLAAAVVFLMAEMLVMLWAAKTA